MNVVLNGTTVLFRADASLLIGSGHIMRCLTLADALRSQGARCIFLSRAGNGDMITFVRDSGFRVVALSDEQEDEFLEQVVQREGIHSKRVVLVIDHYGKDEVYETRLRRSFDTILVIDDLEDRRHNCDFLLDQNFSLRSDRYAGLIPPHCRCLLGPQFALLRPEFRLAREKRKQPDSQNLDSRNVMIFFGGTDPANVTAQALSLLKESGRDYAPRVVVGSGHPGIPQIKEQLKAFPAATLLVQTAHIADIMLACSWYLGAGGSITWERMCLGLSGFVVPVADNQMAFSRDLADAGYQYTVSLLELKEALFQEIPIIRVAEMGQASQKLVDGMGVDRVIQEVFHE